MTKEEQNIFVGIAMMLAGVVLGLYVGVWLCFIGGIVTFIEGATNEGGVQAMKIAWGILKFILSGPLGWLTFWVLFLPGLYKATK